MGLFDFLKKKNQTIEPTDVPKAGVSGNDISRTEEKNFDEAVVKGLEKTRKNIFSGLENVLRAFKKIDEGLFERLEETLIESDIGVETSLLIVDLLRKKAKAEKILNAEELAPAFVEIVSQILTEGETEWKLETPATLLIIGVNGVGKTTTVGKLAALYKGEGKKIALAAADTFRAAAIDQLQVWGDRAGVPVIKHAENSDPAAVAFDAAAAAKARKIDVLMIDTAGRLHNKVNLMNELAKINRVVEREYPEARKETFLVLDATTGQNALQQARVFKEAANITGLILTKLDGTAKGGMIIAIKNELKIPVRFIGVGERQEDLKPFAAREFAEALFTVTD